MKRDVEIVPVEGVDRHSSLLRDCMVATYLLRHLADENRHLSTQDAYLLLKTKMADICKFPWAQMKLICDIEEP